MLVGDAVVHVVVIVAAAEGAAGNIAAEKRIGAASGAAVDGVVVGGCVQLGAPCCTVGFADETIAPLVVVAQKAGNGNVSVGAVGAPEHAAAAAASSSASSFAGAVQVASERSVVLVETFVVAAVAAGVERRGPFHSPHRHCCPCCCRKTTLIGRPVLPLGRV